MNRQPKQIACEPLTTAMDRYLDSTFSPRQKFWYRIINRGIIGSMIGSLIGIPAVRAILKVTR